MEQVDLLYIDSSHERDPTIDEVTTWLPYLARDTPVIFDDFDLPDYPGVAEAIRALDLNGKQEGALFVYWHNTSATAH
jgi:hypothetical protein